MRFDFSTIDMSIEDEKKLRLVFENNYKTSNPENRKEFLRAVKAYKNFDFSQLAFLDQYNLLYKTREVFNDDEELSSRPLLFQMYIFYRNGYLDRDMKKINNNEFEYDLAHTEFVCLPRKLPQGLITEDGVLRTCGVDGHLWLYFFLNLSGVNTNNIIRYGYWTSGEEKIINQKFTHLEKYDYDKSSVYLSKEQAIAMNMLRRLIDPNLSLERFLKEKTENMGFLPQESKSAFESNFDVFYKTFPEEPLEKNNFIEDRFYSKYFFDKERQF